MERQKWSSKTWNWLRFIPIAIQFIAGKGDFDLVFRWVKQCPLNSKETGNALLREDVDKFWLVTADFYQRRSSLDFI